MSRWQWLVLAQLLLVGCRTTPDGPQGQGGARFREVRAQRVAVSAEALFEICWPEAAAPEQRVALVFEGSGAISFEARGGANNSTARCLREIAASYPWEARPSGAVEVAPPKHGPSAWAVLAWVQLLAAGRYGPERGVLEPASLVSACLSRGAGVRQGTRFEIQHEGAPRVRVVPEVTTDSERCVEAVLGATVWPSTRSFTLGFDEGTRGATASAGDVAEYFSSGTDARSQLDPQRVRDALVLEQKAVGACWEEALARRAGLGGARTVRFRATGAGVVDAAWIAGSVSDAGATAADLLLDRCLLAVVRRARFEGGPGEGVYTWVFAVRG